MQNIKSFINNFLFKFGYRLSKVNNTNQLVNIYKYKNYKDYKATQIYYNKKKINHIWADKINLKKICNFIKKNIIQNNIKGICHGSRNGYEQEYFNKNISNAFVIGTDISNTAKKFKNSVVWDFHKEKKRWINKFDFIYSNSLEQSYDPKKALTTWISQVKINGYIIIEHSDLHGVRASGKMDPFGVEANFFPYLISEWFGHYVSLKIIKSIKPNKSNAPVCLFIIKKIKKN